MRELVCDIAFQAGDGKGEGVEGEGEIVSAVGEGTAEGVFDAVVDELDSLIGCWMTTRKQRGKLTLGLSH